MYFEGLLVGFYFFYRYLFLKTSKFWMPHIRNMANINLYTLKLFSRYELLFLDQANSSSDPSQILILHFPTPRASLPPSPSLSNFTIANWSTSLTQSSSCFSSLLLFRPTPFNHRSSQVLDKPSHMPSQANQIYYKSIYRS